MLRKYLLLWLVIASGVALWWPRFSENRWGDPFLQGGSWLGAVVALTMFSVGSILPAHEVRGVLRRWPLILGGTAIQYTAMPALAWGLIHLFPLDRSLQLGVILVGCVPGAMASNVLTLVACGNVSYSVGLTTSATLLSPLIVPLALRLTMGTTADTRLLLQAATNLCLTVVLPTVSGFLLSRVWPRFASWSGRWAESIAQLSILWIIAVVVAGSRERLETLPKALVSCLILLNAGGYLAGELGGRLLQLSGGMRRALIIEVGMQNAGIGASLARSLFPDDPAIALPCGLFAFGCMLSGTILAHLMGRHAGPPLVNGLLSEGRG